MLFWGNSALRFYGNSSERMRLDSSGRLGLGTSSPTALLSVTSSSSGDICQFTTTAGSGQAVKVGIDTTNELVYSRLNSSSSYKYAWQSVAGKTLMVIKNDGSVGIGVTGPSTKLEIGGDAATQLSIDATSGSGLRGIVFKNSGTAICQVTHNASSGEFNIKAGSSGNGGNFITFGTDQGTERARIDSSGRLLIGTSTARSNLFGGSVATAFQVEGTAAATSLISVVSDRADTGGGGIALCHQRSGAVGGNTILQNGDYLGLVSFQGSDGTNFLTGAEVAAFIDGTPGTNDLPSRLVFSSTPSGSATPVERMRIGNVGNHSCRADTGNNVLTVRSGSGAGTSIALIRGTHSSTDPSVDGTGVFVVYTNGNVENANNSYGGFSDIKLKENIVDAGSQWSDLKALQVRKYNFKEGQTHTQIGLVAQEAELVSPGLVSESPDRDEEGNDLGTVTKSVNYSVLYMKAVKALQEAMERIEVLEQRLTDAGIA
jgi:hypothetical protein